MPSPLASSPLRDTTLVAVPLIAVGVVGVYLLTQEPRIQHALQIAGAKEVVRTLGWHLAEALLRPPDATALGA